MNIQTIAGQLAQIGYIVLDQPLLRSQSAQLYSRCHDDERQRFQPARIGRGAERYQLDAIRGDVICWLDDGNGIDHAYLVWMEKLRSGLNEALYLGLFDYECHYAIYGAGAGYARHSDVLNGHRNRVLSTVFYLNEDWQLSDDKSRPLEPPNRGLMEPAKGMFFGDSDAMSRYRKNVAQYMIGSSLRRYIRT